MTGEAGLARRLGRILLLSFGAAVVLAAVAQGEPLSAERSWQIRRIAAPALSPDGRWAVASVATADFEANRLASDLWLFSTDGAVERRLTTDPGEDGSPVWSPDGRRLAYVSKRDGDEAPQVYVLSLEGGEAVRATQWPTGVGQIEWAPDGEHVYFLSRVWPDLDSAAEQGRRLDERRSDPIEAQVYENVSFSAWDTILDDRELHLFRAPLAGGEPVPITLGSGLALPRQNIQLDAVVYDVSPDGQEIAFVADADPSPQTSNLDVFLIPAAGGEPRNVTAENPGADGSPAYSPDGALLAFERQVVPKFYADQRRLLILDRASGGLREVAAEWDRSKTSLVWAPDGRRLYGAIDDAGTIRLYEIPLDGAPRAITPAPSFSNLAVAADGAAVALRQSFLEPPTLVRLDLESGAATPLSTLNDELLAATDLGSYESVTYPGADGAPIQMWVNYPPGFDRSRRHPLFLLIHGGPHNAITDGMQFRWNAQVFSSWGFVTAWPNFHGSSGFGQEFTDSINPRWDDLPYRDVVAAADWLAAQPWIDRDRMVAGGGSYGGYLTTILLGREHPFKALVAHAAVYNLYTQYGADHSTEIPRFGGFWEPGQDEILRHTSPHWGAASFSTPTLVVHGQRDMRVPVNHGLELYQTLLMRGVPARFLYFPDENHWILKPHNSVLWYAEVRRWLESWVAPEGTAPSAGDSGATTAR